tara:strand:- start:711 stop:1028 length:318 start_codon:yes stop_codon:yes gene_type:complete
MIQRIYNNNSFYTKITFPSIFHERYLIKWEPNHRTKLHGHNGKECHFYLLKGTIEETKYNNEHSKISTKIFNTIFDTGHINDKIGKHIIYNVLNKPSYTYHIYKK